MEEAPRGTFQDELDWCIQQLETGLLRRNPTPQQTQDTQKILRVLRSRKAPFVKKRQVMNQVFGNYRLKMAEERRKQEKAAKASPPVQIQEVTHPGSRSVAYKKSPKDGQSTSTHWFTPSDNSFSFNFCTEQTDGVEETPLGNSDDCQAIGGPLDVNSKGNILGAEERSDFSFNFQIPEDAASSSQNCECTISTADTSSNRPPITNTSLVSNVTDMQEAPSLSSLIDCSTSGSVNQKLTQEAAVQSSTDSPRKKKKKSHKKNHISPAEKKVEEHKEVTEKSPPAEESGPTDLQRELDWCVEQLEIGLQRQKSTAKQVEEAMRAIKTLRSEKVPLVKKRQVMRTMFGDYRRKMEDERQKQLRLMQTAAKSARVVEVSETARRKSCKVFRKSTQQSSHDPRQDLPSDSSASAAANEGEILLSTSQEPFCFNFFP